MSQDKDELARLLGAMSDGGQDHSGQPSDDPYAEETHPQELAQEPTPPVTPPAAASRPPVPVARAVVAAQPVPKAAVRAVHRSHLVHSLAFKQTIIPILLTVGVLCPILCIIGRVSGDDSAFAALGKAWFVIPTMLVGVVFLTLAVITIFQVRNDLLRRHHGSPSSPVR